MLVVRRQVSASPSSSGRIRRAVSGGLAAARSTASTSGKSAGSSKGCGPPPSTSWERSRSRTRRWISAMTASTSTAASLPAKAFARSRPDLNVGNGAADRSRLLLQPEDNPIHPALTEDVFRREAALDGALACFIRIAVARILGIRAVAPLPFDRGAVEVGVIVVPFTQLGSGSYPQRDESDRRRGAQRDRRLLRLRRRRLRAGARRQHGGQGGSHGTAGTA